MAVELEVPGIRRLSQGYPNPYKSSANGLV
jgi:hypothetical protein